MALDFFVFSTVFICLSIFFDFIITRLRIGDIGVDFLFFAPWLAGIIYGIAQGTILAIILTAVHVMFHPRVGHFIVTVLPSQVLSVILGKTLGPSGFWLALFLFFLLGTIILRFFGRISGRYIGIIFVNSVLSIFLFFVIVPVV